MYDIEKMKRTQYHLKCFFLRCYASIDTKIYWAPVRDLCMGEAGRSKPPVQLQKSNFAKIGQHRFNVSSKSLQFRVIFFAYFLLAGCSLTFLGLLDLSFLAFRRCRLRLLFRTLVLAG